MTDTFNGDNAHLVSCIEALLKLDARGAIVPHGIGGHARELLSAAASRLDALPASKEAEAVAWQVRDNPEESDVEGMGPAFDVLLPNGEWRACVAVDPDDARNTIREEWETEQKKLASYLPPVGYAHPPTDAGVSEALAGLCPRCAGTGRDPSTTTLQCHKCMGSGAIIIRAALSTAIPAGNGVPPGMVMLPSEPTPDWAYWLATVKQGQSETPRCEPPSAYDLELASSTIKLVLRAAGLLSTASTAGKG